MEERILAKLDEKFEQMEKRLDEKFDERFEQMEKRLDEKLDEKLDKKLMELRKDIKKELLDYMYVFEEEYGRKLTIAFEELSHKSMKEEIQSESIANLERISQMNTAYVYNHEDRIDKLEKVQL